MVCPYRLNIVTSGLGYVSIANIFQVSLMPSLLGENAFGIFTCLYTFTNTLSILTPHPLLETTCNAYFISLDNNAVGCNRSASLSPVNGDQNQVTSEPPAIPSSVTGTPSRVILSGPPLATGLFQTLTTISAESAQPNWLVTLTLYRVVSRGLATGSGTVAEDKPVAGVQL